MRALVIEAPREARVIDQPAPVAGPGEALVRVRRAGLCGTDLSTYLGKNPLVTYPRVIGHEISGIVERIERHGAGAGDTVAADGRANIDVGTRVAISPYKNCGACEACRLGRPNACRNNETLGVQRDGALADLVAVPVTRLYPSASLSLDALALVEPFSIGMHAVRRARVTDDDTVLVMGCGGVGTGAIAGASGRGARVIGVDVDEHKLAQARRFGAAHTVSSADPTLREQIQSLTRREGPQVVIEAVGSASTYRLALEVIASCGRIVCLGWVKGDIALEGRHIVAKEVEILGSRNATDELSEVIALFEKGAIDPVALVSDRVSMAEAPGMLARWAEQPSAVGKVLVSVSD
jgi:threonine dehydrogenase-like Zn-dependent dehydrogenase